MPKDEVEILTNELIEPLRKKGGDFEAGRDAARHVIDGLQRAVDDPTVGNIAHLRSNEYRTDLLRAMTFAFTFGQWVDLVLRADRTARKHVASEVSKSLRGKR